MSKPVRIQRKRTKGWKMPANTVYVGRPTKWGNPFVVGKPGGAFSRKVMDQRHAWQLYRSIAFDNMREALKRLIEYADWQIREGKDHHPTLPSAIGAAREALAAPGEPVACKVRVVERKPFEFRDEMAAASPRALDVEEVAREAFLNLLADAVTFEEQPDADINDAGRTIDCTTFKIIIRTRQMEEFMDALGIEIKWNETTMDALTRAIEAPAAAIAKGSK